MTNFNIIVDQINQSEQIYGSPTPLSKGNMKRKSPNKHSKIMRIHLPLTISNINRDLNMDMYIFYVNGMVFCLSKIGKIITKLTFRNTRQIINSLESYKRTHEEQDFKITDFHGDNEFNIKHLIDYLSPSMVHIYAKDEHVGFIKKSIGTVK